MVGRFCETLERNADRARSFRKQWRYWMRKAKESFVFDPSITELKRMFQNSEEGKKGSASGCLKSGVGREKGVRLVGRGGEGECLDGSKRKRRKLA